MSGWLNQLQSLLGQKTSSGERDLSKLLVPGALGGLAGLLVANKSSRKLLAKYGTGALLAAAALSRAPCCGINTRTGYGPRTAMNRITASTPRRWIYVPNGSFLRWFLPRKATGILTIKNDRRSSSSCARLVLKRRKSAGGAGDRTAA